jgi:hypothetical protein
MKTTITQPTKPKSPAYPVIKRLRDSAPRYSLPPGGELIVLFTGDPGFGTVLHSDSTSRKVGETATFGQDLFEVFTGEVKLSN